MAITNDTITTATITNDFFSASAITWAEMTLTWANYTSPWLNIQDFSNDGINTSSITNDAHSD